MAPDSCAETCRRFANVWLTYFVHVNSVIRTSYHAIHSKGKGKAVPLQAWSSLEGSRKLRFPDLLTTAQDGGKVVSHTHRPHLPPRKFSWYSFLLEAESTPGPYVKSEVLCQWKLPVTPSGIEPAPFKFVAQYLKPLCYRCPPIHSTYNIKTANVLYPSNKRFTRWYLFTLWSYGSWQRAVLWQPTFRTKLLSPSSMNPSKSQIEKTIKLNYLHAIGRNVRCK
jgi:hypothetical protein